MTFSHINFVIILINKKKRHYYFKYRVKRYYRRMHILHSHIIFLICIKTLIFFLDPISSRLKFIRLEMKLQYHQVKVIFGIILKT